MKIRRLLSLGFFYDAVQNILGWYPFQIKVARKYIVGETKGALNICDVGSGTSKMLEYLPRSFRYTGIEPNNLYVKKAREKFGDRGVFLLGGFELLSSLTHKYDLVMAIGVVHHLDDIQVRQFLSLALDVLDKKGFIFLVDPVRLVDSPLISRLLMKFDRGEFIRTKLEYDILFSDHDVRVESETVINPKELLFPFSFLITKLSKLDPH